MLIQRLVSVVCAMWLSLAVGVRVQNAAAGDSGSTPWTTRTAGFLTGWQHRTDIPDVPRDAPAPIGGWISAGSKRWQVELQIMRANERTGVEQQEDPYTWEPIAFRVNRRDTVVDVTVARIFRADRALKPRVFAGGGEVFEDGATTFLIAPPPDSPYWEVSPPGRFHNRRGMAVVGFGLDMAIWHRLFGRFEYRYDFTLTEHEFAGIHQYAGGIGIGF